MGQFRSVGCLAMMLVAGGVCAEDIVLTEDIEITVEAGQTRICDCLGGSGAYTLTKKGAGTLDIHWITNAQAKIVIAEGDVKVTNPRPDAAFAKAYFHVDASELSSMTLEPANGTNFVTRWNDVDGRTERYATPCMTEWRPGKDELVLRTDPANRKPFISPVLQNGKPVMDFGSLLTKYNLDELGRALGYGAAMTFDQETPDVREGYVVAADTDDIALWPTVADNWSSMVGQSFFSHETSYRFVRRSYYSADKAPGLLADNGQNSAYFPYSGDPTVWLDGVPVTSHPKWIYPSAGFHTVRIVPVKDGGAKFDSFAAEFISSSSTSPNRSYGGQKIAEYVIFTDKLDATEATDVHRYLRAKWFPQALASVTLAGGRFQADADVTVEVAKYVVEDNPSVFVPSGTAASFDTFDALDIYGHFDASDSSSLVINAVNGTNFVERWKSLNAPDELYATNYPGTVNALATHRPDPENRFAYVTANASVTGLPAVDFGSFLWTSSNGGDTCKTNWYGAAMVWNQTGGTPAAEVFTVAADDTTRTWPTHSSSRGIASYIGTVSNTGAGFRGSKGALFDYWSSLSGTAITSSGATIRLDGEVVPYTTARPAAGFHVVNNIPSEKINVDAFAHQHRKGSGWSTDTYGGMKIGEFLALKTAISDETVRANVNAYLMNKWLGTPRGRRVYQKIDVATGASFGVVREDVSVASLSVGGTVTASAFTNVTALAATAAAGEIVGPLALADGATLDFAQQADGTWTALKTGAVAVEGAVTIRLDLTNPKVMSGQSVRLLAATDLPASLASATAVCPKALTAVSFEVRADGLYAVFDKLGLMIFVR